MERYRRFVSTFVGIRSILRTSLIAATSAALVSPVLLSLPTFSKAETAFRWGRSDARWDREQPFAPRPVDWFESGRWIGTGVAYGPYRDGQRPGGDNGPTAAQLREDLRILDFHWDCLRVYGAGGPTETLLQSIREMDLELRVMLGVWIEPEEPGTEGDAGARGETANRREIETAIRLANTYRDVVMAISVGNETQVYWSGHRVPANQLIQFVREVRSRTKVPVTTADDFNYWNKTESRELAQELDFLVLHFHPLWNGYQVEDALAAVQTVWQDIRRIHPERAVVLGETGWATRKHTEGEQAKLMKGNAGETEQLKFVRDFASWATRDRIPNFFFEAFDETWKGGAHPDEVEKHWGLYYSDRTPKMAMRHWADDVRETTKSVGVAAP